MHLVYRLRPRLGWFEHVPVARYTSTDNLSTAVLLYRDFQDADRAERAMTTQIRQGETHANRPLLSFADLRLE